MAIGVIIILVLTIIGLIIYNMSIYQKIQEFKNQSRRFANLNILQDFINIVGNEQSAENKIVAINNVIIEKYQIKYSTIVVFDGTNYVVKASNVTQRHWDALSRLHSFDIFKDSIATASPKYITVNGNDEKLPYQDNEFDRAKSAIFFPLYIENVYIGYWIIESGTPHNFDNIDTTIFESVKENIITVLKAIDYQKILENIGRTDQFTELNSAEYLYGEGKKIIDQYTTSAVCMFRISNIEEINKVSRDLGNKVITKVSKKVQESISDAYIFVRYMGPKFVIVFSGVDVESVTEFINEIKENIENMKISLNENLENEQDIESRNQKRVKRRIKREDVKVTPFLNFVVATYYKGTGIEEVLHKMENYLDEASKDENKINNI